MNVAMKLRAGILALAVSLIAPVTHAGLMEGGMWGKLAGAAITTPQTPPPSPSPKMRLVNQCSN